MKIERRQLLKKPAPFQQAAKALITQRAECNQPASVSGPVADELAAMIDAAIREIRRSNEIMHASLHASLRANFVRICPAFMCVLQKGSFDRGHPRTGYAFDCFFRTGLR